jgi:hypothetical protein
MKKYKKNIFAFTGGKTKFADILDALRGLFGVDLLPYLKANNVNTSNIFDTLRAYEENQGLPLSNLGIDINDPNTFDFINTLENANKLLKGNSSFYDVIYYMQDYYNKNNALNNFIFNPFTGRYEVNPKPKIIDKNEPLKQVSQEVKKDLLPPVDENKNVISKNEVFEKTEEQISGQLKEFKEGDQSTVRVEEVKKEEPTKREVIKQAPKQNLLTKIFVSIFKIFR